MKKWDIKKEEENENKEMWKLEKEFQMKYYFRHSALNNDWNYSRESRKPTTSLFLDSPLTYPNVLPFLTADELVYGKSDKQRKEPFYERRLYSSSW